jgi:Flp pilus assembly protein TadG
MKVRRNTPPDRSRGAILPLLALGLVGVCGFVALSVDLGMLATAKSQAEAAADAAAVAGARTLNGASGSNLTQATANAQAVAQANTILGVGIATTEVSVRHGAYHYDASAQTFSPLFPPGAGDNYNLSEVTITHTYNSGFAKVLGVSTVTVTAKSTAAHRPRDVAIVLDFSGSMNNESDLWNCESYLGSLINTPNNTDSSFPQWGVHSTSFSPLANFQCTSNSSLVGKCNVTTTVLGVPALVTNLFKNSRGATASSAFSAAGSSITNTAPGGDNYSNKKNSTNPALCWQDITGSSSTKFSGYGAAFKGYTQGPGYWGKTFFMWPPDSRAAKDWRKLYFELSSGVACNDNTQLWDSGGNWQDPPGNYIINYKAILAWITSNPNPFPSQLRAGNILYYSSIPTDVPASAYTHTNANSQITNQDQRFWKEYIDFTIGVWRAADGNIQRPGNPSCSLGPDFTAGSSSSGSGVVITGPDATYAGQVWIGPTDNPLRPRHRFWFGPATMVQYMLDTGLLPGTMQDISMIAAKLGIQGALQDIQNNHPNDLVSLIMYSRPPFSGEAVEVGQFGQPQVVLTNDYSKLQNALWYPPNSSSADVRPWDSNGLQTPSAHGDYDSNTATSYGLMLAYNQLSSSASLRGATSGGYGRKGAQKLVILETDGMANVSSNVSITNAGSYNSYYTTTPLGTASAGSADPASEAVTVATNICALDSAGPTPGYSTVRNPAYIHCLAFGAIFEPGASGSDSTNAVSLLQQISNVGGTTFPSSSADATNGYKWCIGTLTQRQSKLQQAFTTIMDQEVSVILVANSTN